MAPTQHNENAPELLPGWSTLAMMLAIFAIVSAIALLTILRGASTDHADNTGTHPYTPDDFPEIAWDEPLLPAVLAAEEGGKPAAFNVPPAPFSEEGIFPCTECHADLEVDTDRRELGFHEEIVLNHGPEERWCLDCHSADNRDRLRLATGGEVGFDESYRLCGQCHGTIFRDWRQGIHGQRRGFWNGAKSYLLCAHCHNPHSPRFALIEPLPPPVGPLHLGKTQTATEGHAGAEP